MHVHVHAHMHMHAYVHIYTGLVSRRGRLEPRRRIGRQRCLVARRLDEHEVVRRCATGATTLRALSPDLGRAELCNARGGQRRAHLGV